MTDWLVLPLRRVLPAIGRWDTAKPRGRLPAGADAVRLLWLLAGAAGSVAVLPLLAVFGLLRLVISGLTGLVIVSASCPGCSPIRRSWT